MKPLSSDKLEAVIKRGQRSRISALAAIVLVFLLNTSVLQAQKYSVLYNFPSLGNGQNPTHPGIIAQGQDGSLYSTTLSGCGGFNLSGEVFKISPQGKFKTVVCVNSAVNLGGPYSGVTLGTDGQFYGTSIGGDYYGGVWKTTAAGKLTNFAVFGTDPNVSEPLAPPVLGMDGNLYGSGGQGGTSGSCTYSYGGCGGIYKMAPTGKNYSVLYRFAPTKVQTDGSNPVAPLILGTDGNFYGTTSSGGTSTGRGFGGGGVIFKLTPSGSYSVLYNFCSLRSCVDGEFPYAGLVQGSDGNFYGTTNQGGARIHAGGFTGGAIFSINPITGKYTVLYSFCALVNCADGANPTGGLVQASDSNLYGTTQLGGTKNDGTIFQITPSGAYTVLYNFDNTTGAQPEAALIQHTNGILYGDTLFGGTSSRGVFFSLDLGLPPFAELVAWWGKVGTNAEILGQGFKGATSVTFNGTPATFKIVNDTYITATIPVGSTSGPVSVVTSTGTLAANHNFVVFPGITSFSPTSGPVGTAVTILGTGFTGATKVTFGGISASFTVTDNGHIAATVPTSAVTGKIVVTSPAGTFTSSGTFTVH